MKYEAIESFSGIISMVKGEVREISNESLAKDLINANLIKKYVATNVKVLKEELDQANVVINNLTKENNELKTEIEKLLNLIEKKKLNDDNSQDDDNLQDDDK